MQRKDVTKELFELVTVLGNKMLYTGSRCDRTTVPEGAYMYEVREDDELQGIPCEIAPSIGVNFWGTLITDEPIRLGKTDWNGKPYRMIGYDDWGYESEDLTLSDFLKRRERSA